MTVAVCIKCGTMKHGALTPCPTCGFDPENYRDKAKAMILTDHILSKEDLETISIKIQHSEEVKYPEDAVNEYVKIFEDNPDIGNPSKTLLVGCLVGGLILIGVAIYFFVY